MFKHLREPVNGLTHLVAAVVAAVGVVGLVFLAQGTWTKQVALFVYGASLILMFSASAAYHLVVSEPAVLLRFRKLDHAAIYLFIAGTYTPICLQFFDGFWRWAPLVVIWSLALVGVAVKLFIIETPRWVTAGVYLLMGWMAIVSPQNTLLILPAGALTWLLVGGLFFTLGAAIYITKRPDPFPGVFGFHEIWHIFVILGCLSHFILMALFVAPATFAL